MVISLNPRHWIVPESNPELRWMFSLIGETGWRVVAYRRVYLAKLPQTASGSLISVCHHQEVAWLWAHHTLPDSFLYDTDREDIGDVTELSCAKLVSAEHAVDIITGESDWIVLHNEPGAPEWAFPIIEAIRQRVEDRVEGLQRELQLAQPGSEQEHVLSQELDRARDLPFVSVDVRNHACDVCDP